MQHIQEANILLVDDSRELLDILRAALMGAGYTNLHMAESCAAARAAFAALAAAGRGPELMILDINLPDGDGFSLYRELNGGGEIPTLFLSARDEDCDRLFGLGLGADDYMTKPFLTQELLLRVERILHRAYRQALEEGKNDGLLVLGAYTADLEAAVVHGPGGATTPLTATERTILQKLAENRGGIVTFDALCEAVWQDGYSGYENTLNVHMRHLREKLEENPSKPRYLLTARGLGYKLAGPRGNVR